MNSRFLSGESIDLEGTEEATRLNHRISNRFTAIKSRAGRVALALLPSPLNQWKSRDRESASRGKTAYLDGIRGIGALMVFIQHFVAPFQPAIVGDRSREINSWFAFQYPVIRLFYSGGSFAVALFFVLSGFALSRKPLVLKKTVDTDYGLIESEISSEIFRRGIRLFLPAISIVLVMTMGACIGAYEEMVPGLPVDRFDLRSPKRLSSILDQISDASYFVLSQLFYPSQWLHRVVGIATGTYGFHLWTISIEFWASQLLFLCLLASIRYGKLVRVTIMSLLACYSIWCFRWEIALFLIGAMICDFDLSESQKSSKPILAERAILQIVPWLCCFFGLWIGSMPDFNGEVTPGFRFLWAIVPWEPLWHSIGAVLVIWSITRSQVLQVAFNLQVVQYLGKISFSMYLVHVPIVSSFGWWSVYSLLTVIDPQSQAAYQALVWTSGVVYLAFVIWIADIFWRFVDGPSIRLAKYWETRLQGDEAIF